MRTPLHTLGLVLNIERPDARAVGRLICQTSARLRVPIFIEALSAKLLGRQGMPLSKVVDEARGLVVAGGDGTLLTTVNAAAVAKRAVLGINVGSLGFLTSIPKSQAARAVERFIKGEWEPQQRTLLDVRLLLPGKTAQSLGLALNDCVLSRKCGSRLARFSVWVDESLVSEYAADGIVVATPTGSTAYSLAAGGALVTPNAPVLCLTPICPHALTNRPVVVSDQSVLRIRPQVGTSMAVTLDGRRETVLPEGAQVEIKLSTERLVLATPKTYNFFGVLRSKLHWSGSSL